MNTLGILAYLLLVLVILVFINAIQFLSILRKFSTFAVVRILSSYFILGIWVVLTVFAVILNELGLVMLETSAPYLMLLFTACIQLLIYANSSVAPKLSIFVQVAFALGWVIAGMVLAQLIFPEITFVTPLSVNGVYAPRIHPALVLVSAIRGAILIFLLSATIKRTLLEQDKNFLLFPYLSLIFSVGGLLLFFAPRFAQNFDLALIFYATGRILIILAVLLFFENIRKDPLHQLGAILGINLIFIQKHVHLALFSYGEKGVQIIFESGFYFYPQEDERYVNLLSLGLASLTALGRGEEYLEGSAIIPLLDPFQMTGLVLTGWVTDPDQMDPRLGGMSYLSLLILINREYDFLFRNRKHWEMEFQKFLASKSKLSEITRDDVYDFSKKALILVALPKIM